MLEVDFSIVKSRSDVDRQLSPFIRSARIRQFLLKNVIRNEVNRYSWKLNLPSLHQHLPEIMEGLKPGYVIPEKGIMGFPVLFIKGENSNYISEDDIPFIHDFFADVEIITIPGAGHWLHAEQPVIFINALKNFIRKKLDYQQI
jgi:pimeloyl-ACP methyl ester carboxylesterase